MNMSTSTTKLNLSESWVRRQCIRPASAPTLEATMTEERKPFTHHTIARTHDVEMQRNLKKGTQYAQFSIKNATIVARNLSWCQSHLDELR